MYKSAVDAFPNTTKRQYATNTVKVTKIEWTPYLGMKTLYAKALIQNEGKEYKAQMLFKGVVYHEQMEKGLVRLVVNDQSYLLEQLSSENTQVLVRCSCPDFRYRFNYYDFVDKSLSGTKATKYEGQNLWKANPLELPGVCKHLMKFHKALQESNILS